MSEYEPEQGGVGADRSEARSWAMVCHLGGLAKFTAIPCGGIIGALIAWQMKKNEFPLVDDQGKEALNFQISVLLAWLATGGLVVFGIVMPPLLILGALLFGLISIGDVVLTIIAAVEANKGKAYRYPVNIRFVK